MPDNKLITSLEEFYHLRTSCESSENRSYSDFIKLVKIYCEGVPELHIAKNEKMAKYFKQKLEKLDLKPTHLDESLELASTLVEKFRKFEQEKKWDDCWAVLFAAIDLGDINAVVYATHLIFSKEFPAEKKLSVLDDLKKHLLCESPERSRAIRYYALGVLSQYYTKKMDCAREYYQKASQLGCKFASVALARTVISEKLIDLQPVEGEAKLSQQAKKTIWNQEFSNAVRSIEKINIADPLRMLDLSFCHGLGLFTEVWSRRITNKCQRLARTAFGKAVQLSPNFCKDFLQVFEQTINLRLKLKTSERSVINGSELPVAAQKISSQEPSISEQSSFPPLSSHALSLWQDPKLLSCPLVCQRWPLKQPGVVAAPKH